MKPYEKQWLLCVLVVASLFLAGLNNDAVRVNDRAKLIKRQKQLHARIVALRREQDYLHFQKAMYESDSKYLIIHVARRTGQMKYKNRVLKDFSLKRLSGRLRRTSRGVLTLTKKIGGFKKNHALIFGRSILLQGKRTPVLTRAENGIPRFGMSTKDFLSLYYAVEVGAKAYLLP